MEGGKVIATTTSDASGAYSVATPTLSDATHALTAQATAPSATSSVNSPNLDVVVDTTINAKDDTATSIDEDHTGAITGSVITNDDHVNGETVAATSALKTAYGAYTLNADGTYTFTVDTKASQSLAQGQSATDTLTYEITDKAGNTATATLTTTITGTNDQPEIVIAQHPNIAGTFGVTDLDTTDTHTFSIANTGVGHYGTLSLDPASGAYSYSQNPSVVGMHLDAKTGKYSGQDVFEIKVDDNHGGTSSKFIEFAATATLSSQTTVTHTGNTVAIPNVSPHIVIAVTVLSTAPTVIPPSTAITNDIHIDLAYTSDSGQKSDKTTSDTTPQITGWTDVPFSKVVIMDGGKIVGTTFSDAHGVFYVSTSVLTEAVHTLTAQATAPSVTTPVTSAPLDITIDTSVNATDDTSTTTEDSTSVSGNVLTNDDHANGETVAATSALKTAHGAYTLNADGTYTFTVDTKASQSLAQGQSATDTLTYEITDKAGNTATAILTTTITGNDDLVVDTGARDLGSTAEDTVTHFTEAQLLNHLSDADGKLSVVAGSLSTAHGTITGDATHGYDFTPSLNYKGQDLDISYKVTDGTTEYAKTAQVDVTTVTDAATVSLGVTAQQEVMSFAAHDKTAFAKVDGINAGGDMHEMSSEVTFAFDAGTPPNHYGVLLNYSTPGHTNLITFWHTDSLEMAFMGTTVNIGISLVDGATHRLTMSWESKTGHLSIYDNGVSIKEVDNMHTGETFPDGGTFIVGTRTNSAGADNPADYTPGFSAGGKVFAATMVDHAVSAKDVTGASISTQSHGVLTNIMVDAHGTIADSTSLHTVVTGAGSHTAMTAVSTSVGTIPGGALLTLNPTITPPTDTDDKISQVDISGLDKGIVLSDGAHSHTVTGPTDKLNIQAWDLSKLTAQLPAGQSDNMNVVIAVTTTGPDGVSVVTSDHTPLMLNPNAPIPDAIITGDDDKTTDEDTSISGVLHVTDGDASQAHFATNPTTGTYGKVTMQADGHWTFTPNATANALNAGDVKDEVFTVKSADGTSHDISIHLTGTNDAPIVSSPVPLAASTEDTVTTFTAAQLLTNASDVDTKDTLSVSGAVTADHGTVTGPDATGNYQFTPDANYHGAVSFTYDIADTHGGVVHTSATTTLASVVDAATVTTAPATGDEDTAIALSISAATTGDTIDHYTITGLPVGATLSAGHDNGHGSWTVNAADIGSLKLTPPANYAGDIGLHVTATVTDGVTSVDSTSQVISVHVNPIADTPNVDSLSFNGVSALAGPPKQILDYTITLTQDMVDKLNEQPHHNQDVHSSALALTNGINILDIAQLSFNGRPIALRAIMGFDTEHILSDSILQARGVNQAEFHVGDTIAISFNPGISPTTTGIRPSVVDIVTSEQSGLFAYAHDARYLRNHLARDAFDGVNRFALDDIHLIQKIETTPTTAKLDVDEDAQFNLVISASTPDKDGSETLEVHVEGLPAGATLNHGTRQTDGSYLVAQSQLQGLQVNLAKDYRGSVDLDVSVVSHDGASTQTSPKSHLHVDVHSVVDLANIDVQDIRITEHEDWQTLDITASATDTHDPVTSIIVRGLSTNSEIRLNPTFSGTAPVHNSDGTWTIDPASVGHLQIHTTATAGNYEDYRVVVTTTDSAGATATTQHSGHFLSKAVIEGHFDINTAHTGIVSNIGELVKYTPSTDADEKAYVIVEVKPGVTLVDDAGKELHVLHYNAKGRVGGAAEHYEIAAADLAHAHVRSSIGTSGLDIHIEARIEEGSVAAQQSHLGTNAATSVKHDFTAIDLPNHAPTATALTDTVAEDASSHHSLDLLTGATDTDGDTLTITGLDTSTLPAGVTLDADGHTLIVDATDISFQHLAAGQHQDVVVNYQVSDGKGGSTAQTATIAVTGTHDLPVLTLSTPTTTADAHSTLRQYITTIEQHGTESVIHGHTEPGWAVAIYDGATRLPGWNKADAQGNFTLTVPKLSDGTHHIHVEGGGHIETTEIFEVTASHVEQISITEDQVGHITGVMGVSDLDDKDAPQIATQTDTKGTYGEFSIDAKGVWQYELDNTKAATNNLNNGDEVQETFSVTVTTASGESVTKDIVIDVKGHTDTVVATPISQADDVTIVLETGSDTGVDTHDHITKDNTPTVAGLTHTPNSHVEIFEGGKVIATTTADASGFYSVAVPTLGDGAHSLTAQATAPGATTATSSQSLDMVVDTQTDAHVNTFYQEAGHNDQVHFQLYLEKDTEITNLQIVDSQGHHLDVSSSSQFGQFYQSAHSPDHGYLLFDKIDVSSLSDGELHIVADVTDKAGNIAQIDSSSTKTFDLITSVSDESEAQQVETSEVTVTLQEDAMPSLDNVAEHLQALKTETTAPTPEHQQALASAAHLLDETHADSVKVIQAVENQKPLDHIKNPNAPDSHTSHGDGVDAAHSDGSDHVDYAPDMHPQIPQDDDHNDGTGLT